ncbi:hypothetical protein [Flavobacterium capsici]|uniref:Uncharacterized protein n=1 Tax=Flavobacterium capsici TaxID=3075618 RepID=A0AA96EW69_9FLAO|nr:MULTISPECIES: hypothetical protein [unclassified Flavobacterium]WNM19743.1 hypothetical protein RN608_03445 [Flavobacterium sp. PMR2A8]WNM21132.1 hypothetical protein RN605_10615 [Flavobacterium sp. PMTSA4]
MKTKLLLVACSFLFLSMQCDDDNDSGITPEMLNNKKQEIISYINSFNCSESSNCNYIAFGAKPCGGPREFLTFPSSVDLPTLQTMVDEYFEMDNAYNIQTGAVSDCAIVNPPSTMDCVNGNCIIIN